MVPIIGIVSRAGIVFDKYDVQVTEETYRNAIIQSGGMPITILPSQTYSFESIAPKNMPKMTIEEKLYLNHVLDLCDGIVMPGGYKTYEYDYYICEYALEHNIPILGICAGMQIMARLSGHGLTPATCEKTIMNHKNINHNITIEKNTLLHDILGKEELEVNSFHNYRISSRGSWNISAMCPEDSTIEAVECNTRDFFLGLQWHPEKTINEDEDSKKLFKAFTDTARRHQRY